MKNQIKDTNDCTGKTPLINKHSMGGHMEDYVSDPNDKTPISHNLKWVPVSQSFKKD